MPASALLTLRALLADRCSSGSLEPGLALHGLDPAEQLLQAGSKFLLCISTTEAAVSAQLHKVCACWSVLPAPLKLGFAQVDDHSCALNHRLDGRQVCAMIRVVDLPCGCCRIWQAAGWDQGAVRGPVVLTLILRLSLADVDLVMGLHCLLCEAVL